MMMLLLLKINALKELLKNCQHSTMNVVVFSVPEFSLVFFKKKKKDSDGCGKLFVDSQTLPEMGYIKAD